MAKVEILLTGLTVAGKVYRAGDIEEKPGEHLLSLAQGKQVLGQIVARIVEGDSIPLPISEAKPDGVKPEPVKPPYGGNSNKKGR